MQLALSWPLEGCALTNIYIYTIRAKKQHQIFRLSYMQIISFPLIKTRKDNRASNTSPRMAAGALQLGSGDPMQWQRNT